MNLIALPDSIRQWIDVSPATRRATVDAVTLPAITVLLFDGDRTARGHCQLSALAMSREGATSLAKLQPHIEACVETAFLRALEDLQR